MPRWRCSAQLRVEHRPTTRQTAGRSPHLTTAGRSIRVVPARVGHCVGCVAKRAGPPSCSTCDADRRITLASPTCPYRSGVEVITMTWACLAAAVNAGARRRNRSGSVYPKASSRMTGTPASPAAPSGLTRMAHARRARTDSCSRAPVESESKGTTTPPRFRATREKSSGSTSIDTSGPKTRRASFSTSFL